MPQKLEQQTTLSATHYSEEGVQFGDPGHQLLWSPSSLRATHKVPHKALFVDVQTQLHGCSYCRDLDGCLSSVSKGPESELEAVSMCTDSARLDGVSTTPFENDLLAVRF